MAGKDGDGGDDDGDVEEDRGGDGGVSGDGRELDPVHDGDDDGGLRFLSICSDMAAFGRRDPMEKVKNENMLKHSKTRHASMPLRNQIKQMVR